MFFLQVTCTTISFNWRIIGTTSLLISITNVVFLIFKWVRVLLLLLFSTSGILSSFALAQITSMAKKILLKLIKSDILSIDTYEQDILSVGDKRKKIKEEYNNCNHMTMLSFFSDSHCLPLFHMAKSIIWIEEKKDCINEFSIGYMINPKLNINKAFR